MIKHHKNSWMKPITKSTPTPINVYKLTPKKDTGTYLSWWLNHQPYLKHMRCPSNWVGLSIFPKFWDETYKVFEVWPPRTWCALSIIFPKFHHLAKAWNRVPLHFSPDACRKNLGLPWSPRPTKFTGGTAAITGGLGRPEDRGNPGFGWNKLLINLLVCGLVAIEIWSFRSDLANMIYQYVGLWGSYIVSFYHCLVNFNSMVPPKTLRLQFSI